MLPGLAPTRLLLLAAIGAACTRQHSLAVAPGSWQGFRVLGPAARSDSGPPTLLLDNRSITIRGAGLQRTDGGLYADIDSAEPGTLRLTLYDSVPGRTLQEAIPAPGWIRVRYEARVGPLPAGPYEMWVGRWDPVSQSIVVTTEPLRIDVP